MTFIKQANISVSVTMAEDSVIAQSLYLDREKELQGTVCADINTYNIKEAFCEIVKETDKDMEGLRRISFPEGTKCHIDGKRRVAGLLGEPRNRHVKYMMDQCINGMIQAESYIYRERGFEDRESYNRFWDEIEEKGCRMYSHPHRDDLRWMDYIPQYERKHLLFSRYKNIEIKKAGNAYEGRARFIDSYHELYADCCCDEKTGDIEIFEISYCRAPGKCCFDNSIHSGELLGRNIFRLTKGELVEIFGRSEGCYHLVELSKDLVEFFQESEAELTEVSHGI